MEWIGCVRCEKSGRDFVAQTFALMCSPCFATSFIQLWNDPKCTQTLCNAPKFEFTVQWGGLGAFVAKNPYVTSWHEFCINCTSSPYFSSSFMELRNDPKCTKTWVYGPMEWIGCVRGEKSRRDFVARTFALIGQVHPVLHRVWGSYETIPNAPNTMRRTKTWV